MSVNTLSPQAFATASTVRAWAVANGLPAGGERGLLPAATIKAYNAKNGLKFKYASYKKVVEVETRDKRNKKVVRKVNVAAARSVLLAAGEPVGKRGRLSTAQLQKALALA
jgi:hypothetical protein